MTTNETTHRVDLPVREILAAVCMHALLSDRDPDKSEEPNALGTEWCAYHAVVAADALIAELKGGAKDDSCPRPA